MIVEIDGFGWRVFLQLGSPELRLGWQSSSPGSQLCVVCEWGISPSTVLSSVLSHSILCNNQRNVIQKNLPSCRDHQADVGLGYCGESNILLKRSEPLSSPLKIRVSCILRIGVASLCCPLRVLHYLGKQQGAGAPCPVLQWLTGTAHASAANGVISWFCNSYGWEYL